MEKFYYVGVFLSKRVSFGLYGFSSYVDCYTKAESLNQAGQLAKEYFENKYKVSVTGTRPQAARHQDVEKYANPEQIINLVPRNS